jgi:hypothetical protein
MGFFRNRHKTPPFTPDPGVFVNDGKQLKMGFRQEENLTLGSMTLSLLPSTAYRHPKGSIDSSVTLPQKCNFASVAISMLHKNKVDNDTLNHEEKMQFKNFLYDLGKAVESIEGVKVRYFIDQSSTATPPAKRGGDFTTYSQPVKPEKVTIEMVIHDQTAEAVQQKVLRMRKIIEEVLERPNGVVVAQEVPQQPAGNEWRERFGDSQQSSRENSLNKDPYRSPRR